MDRCEEERLIEVPISRRKLIQAGATTGLMAAVGGLSLPFSFTSQAANKTAIVEDKAVWKFLHSKLWKSLPASIACKR